MAEPQDRFEDDEFRDLECISRKIVEHWGRPNTKSKLVKSSPPLFRDYLTNLISRELYDVWTAAVNKAHIKYRKELAAYKKKLDEAEKE